MLMVRMRGVQMKHLCDGCRRPQREVGKLYRGGLEPSIDRYCKRCGEDFKLKEYRRNLRVRM